MLESKLNRVLDANLNRLREALRVVEDITRYVDNNKDRTKRVKELRHRARLDDYIGLLESRDIINDCSKESTKSEKSRDSIEDVVVANFKRAQESSRVLEECLKILNSEESIKFKNIRYALYDIEKEMLLSIKG